MQIIKNILNDLNKSYELILNVSLFSSIIIILQSFIFYEVDIFNISFLHNNLTFKYNKIDDGLDVENQKLGYLELKNYLEKNNITLNDFDINHLNLIKIMSY